MGNHTKLPEQAEMAHRTWARSELTPYQLGAEIGAGHPGCGAVVSRMPWGDPPATNTSVKGKGAATCPDLSGTSLPTDSPVTEHLHRNPLQMPRYLSW